MMREDNIEFELMYDLTCWHCKKIDEGCKGKPHSVSNCVSFEEKKEYRNDKRRTN